MSLPNASKRILFAILLSFPFISFSQNHTSLLGRATEFAVLSGGSVQFSNNPHPRGHVGGLSGINGLQSNPYDSIIPPSADIIAEAVAMITIAKAAFTLMPSSVTSGNLSGTYFPGVYTLAGNASIAENTVIHLATNASQDPATAVYIFNIPGNLTAGHHSVIDIGDDINPANIIWNIQNDAFIREYSVFTGIILTSGEIILENFTEGAKSLLASGNISAQSSENMQSAENMSAFSVNSIPAICSETSTCNSQYNDGCNLLPNPEICAPGLTSGCDLNSYSSCSVPGWRAAQGSPEYFAAGINSPSSGDLFMWARDIIHGEAVYTCAQVDSGQQYILSYYRRVNGFDISTQTVSTTGNLDSLNFYLVDESTFVPNPGGTRPGVPAKHQLIKAELAITHNNPTNSWVRGWACFTANKNYNLLWIYPREVNHIQSNVQIDQIELFPDYSNACQ